MWKAAPVPQQLTPLLQEAACHVDGISPPLLPVTNPGGAADKCFIYVFVLPVVESYHKQKAMGSITSHQTLKCQFP